MIAIAAAVVLIAAVLVWLFREHQKLKRDYRLLAEQLHSHKEDLAGLCAAAVVVDQHLAANDLRLNGILDNVTASRTPTPVKPVVEEDEPHGYDAAIQKIRRGAGVDELVKDYGLTRDEAVLLMRLHGDKRV